MSRSTLPSMMPANAADDAAPDNATPNLASVIFAMQQQIASLQASQAVANREITYLRSNNDRVVRDISSEFRQLRREVMISRNQLGEIEKSQKRLQWRMQHSEASGSESSSVPPTDTRTPTPTQSRPRHLELRRQGAFHGGDINNLPWAELNDVRGFNPDIPRYHWSVSSPPMWTHNPNVSRKRTRDELDTEPVPFTDQVKPRRGKGDPEGGASPTQRRKITKAVRIARMTTTIPKRASAQPRHATPPNSAMRRSSSFISGVISSVSSVFHS